MLSIEYYNVEVFDNLTQEQSSVNFKNLEDAQQFADRYKKYRVSKKLVFSVCENAEDATTEATTRQKIAILKKLSATERRILGFNI